jgi:antitoxin ParD1/3/4
MSDPDRTSINVSLPGSMRKWVVEQVSEGGYGTVSEYIRDLVRDAQRGQVRAETEKLLVDSLTSPSSEMTDSDWSDLRARARKADSAARKRRSR